MQLQQEQPRMDIKYFDPAHDSLAVIASKLKGLRKMSATAENYASILVTELANSWEERLAEADGVSCDAWLKAVTNYNLAYWKRTYNCLMRLGKPWGAKLDHAALVWTAGVVTDGQIPEVKTAVSKATRELQDKPLTLGMAKKVVFSVIGQPRVKRKVCQRCKALEALLRKHDIDPALVDN